MIITFLTNDLPIFFVDVDKLFKILEAKILEGYIRFYCVYNSPFDRVVAYVLSKLKVKYPYIIRYWIREFKFYDNLKSANKIKKDIANCDYEYFLINNIKEKSEEEKFWLNKERELFESVGFNQYIFNKFFDETFIPEKVQNTIESFKNIECTTWRVNKANLVIVFLNTLEQDINNELIKHMNWTDKDHIYLEPKKVDINDPFIMNNSEIKANKIYQINGKTHLIKDVVYDMDYDKRLYSGTLTFREK